MSDETTVNGKQHWHGRGYRFATGCNVCLATALAAAVLVMVNIISERHYARWDLSERDYYRLSPKTVSLLSDMQASVDVVVFFRRGHELYPEVRNLVKEYEYAADRVAELDLNVRFIDPDRDMAAAKDLARDYDVGEVNVVIIRSAGRTRYIPAKDIMAYDISFDDGRPSRKRAAFLGEMAFSSALQSVVQKTRPVVYFLTGHGERAVDDFSENAGYSSLARLIRRDNVEIRELLLAEHKCVPDDCSALVIAGPDRRLSQAELDMLSDYLDANGRILLLIDPVVTTGLEPLLARWGLNLVRDVVVGLTLTGRELVIKNYGEHPVTRSLRRATTMFYMPRSVEPAAGQVAPENVPADRPRVTVLAVTTEDGWAEANLSASPAKFDPEVDRAGPVSVAVAVEKGPVNGIEVELKPARMVVIGDSYFVSNGALNSAVGGNADFFLSALNWLLEREALMAIAARAPGELKLDMDSGQIRNAFLVLSFAVPAAVALLGLVVWLRRRR